MKRPAERVLAATLRDLEGKIAPRSRRFDFDHEDELLFHEGWSHGDLHEDWLERRLEGPFWSRRRRRRLSRLSSLWIGLISTVYKILVELRTVWYSILFR